MIKRLFLAIFLILMATKTGWAQDQWGYPLEDSVKIYGELAAYYIGLAMQNIDESRNQDASTYSLEGYFLPASGPVFKDNNRFLLGGALAKMHYSSYGYYIVGLLPIRLIQLFRVRGDRGTATYYEYHPIYKNRYRVHDYKVNYITSYLYCSFDFSLYGWAGSKYRGSRMIEGNHISSTCEAGYAYYFAPQWGLTFCTGFVYENTPNPRWGHSARNANIIPFLRIRFTFFGGIRLEKEEAVEIFN
jgi:hypothetical protein